MDNIDNYGVDAIEVSQLNPTNWGDLVIARSEDGDVLGVDPQLYWEGVAGWYRARGDDPHRWSDHH
jgi:hypothetical protein